MKRRPYQDLPVFELIARLVEAAERISPRPPPRGRPGYRGKWKRPHKRVKR